MNKEAARQNNNYVADSFRYEPIGWDYGKTLHNKKGIYLWTVADWTDRKTDYWSFNYPNGTNLSSTILELIGNFYKIVSIEEDPKNPDKPKYTCKKYKYLNDFATIYDVYNANNGWGSDSYPNKLYKRMGPCSVRENWDVSAFGSGNYVAFHNNKYYCNKEKEPEKECGTSQSAFIKFLKDEKNLYAQIPIGSSYGLLQVWYIKATSELGWKEKDKDNCNRKPELLLDVDESLDMGSYFDAKEMRGNATENQGVFEDFEKKLKEAFAKYDEGEEGYGDDVMSRVSNFKPKN